METLINGDNGEDYQTSLLEVSEQTLFLCSLETIYLDYIGVQQVHLRFLTSPCMFIDIP